MRSLAALLCSLLMANGLSQVWETTFTAQSPVALFGKASTQADGRVAVAGTAGLDRNSSRFFVHVVAGNTVQASSRVAVDRWAGSISRVVLGAEGRTLSLLPTDDGVRSVVVGPTGVLLWSGFVPGIVDGWGNPDGSFGLLTSEAGVFRIRRLGSDGQLEPGGLEIPIGPGDRWVRQGDRIVAIRQVSNGLRVRVVHLDGNVAFDENLAVSNLQANAMDFVLDGTGRAWIRLTRVVTGTAVLTLRPEPGWGGAVREFALPQGAQAGALVGNRDETASMLVFAQRQHRMDFRIGSDPVANPVPTGTTDLFPGAGSAWGVGDDLTGQFVVRPNQTVFRFPREEEVAGVLSSATGDTALLITTAGADLRKRTLDSGPITTQIFRIQAPSNPVPVALAPDGLGGFYTLTVENQNAGSTLVQLSRLGANGATVWSAPKRFGYSFNPFSLLPSEWAMVPLANGDIVDAIESDRSILVRRLARASGRVLWTRRVATVSSRPIRAILARNGHPVILLTPVSDNERGTVVQLDQGTGAVRWLRRVASATLADVRSGPGGFAINGDGGTSRISEAGIAQFVPQSRTVDALGDGGWLEQRELDGVYRRLDAGGRVVWTRRLTPFVSRALLRPNGDMVLYGALGRRPHVVFLRADGVVLSQATLSRQDVALTVPAELAPLAGGRVAILFSTETTNFETVSEVVVFRTNRTIERRIALRRGSTPVDADFLAPSPTGFAIAGATIRPFDERLGLVQFFSP